MHDISNYYLEEELLVISSSGALLFSSEELHSHFFPVNAFLPAVIKVIMLQPDTIKKTN